MNPFAASRALVLEGFADADKWAHNAAAAEALLAEALKKAPENVSALTCMGAVLCDQARYREAVDVLQRAVQLGSIDRNTHFNLGVALMACGTRDKALAAFERAQRFSASNETWEAYFDPQAQ
jgi:predicted Zn-dependent protease